MQKILNMNFSLWLMIDVQKAPCLFGVSASGEPTTCTLRGNHYFHVYHGALAGVQLCNEV